MKFIATINGEKVSKDIPTSWKQITFKTYLDLIGIPNTDPVKILSVLVGVPEDTLNKSKIVGLDSVLKALSFMRTEAMDFGVPETILGHKVPKDLNWETTGQFKDCQQIAQSLKPVKDEIGNDILSRDDQQKYLEIVAIYAMPDYCDASAQAQSEFSKKFYEAPCEEVLAIGNFTLLKLIALNLNIKKEPQSKSGPLKRLRQAFKIWRLNLGFTIRYWRLQKTLTNPKTRF